ncbi:hypothetical protein A1356_18960 [Methylomonas koyamae]|uniref:Uncharacterized protein n=1 Tax=Methylomonas koyamae TaxID=702114 RepID=A0AA91D9U9_9GAMM|nr:hypothetical protein A1356_18960 [Methylomonas koyamae]
MLDNVDYSTLISALLTVFAALVILSLLVIGYDLIIQVITPKKLDFKRYQSAVIRKERRLGRSLTKSEADKLSSRP